MSDRTARELVQYLRGRGISTAEISNELQRSPRMVRKILNGETSGALYRESLEELATTGHTSRVPPRRRRKDGTLAPVRGKRTRSGESRSVVPKDPGGTYVDDKQGGRFRTETTYMAEGGRHIRMSVPKSHGAKGREQANSELVNQVRNAAKGQARDKQKQISATLTFANGRQMQVNTYNASTMLKRMRDSGGDALGWFRRESKIRYSNLDLDDIPITGVSLNVATKAKTPEYEAQSARGRVRTSRRLTAAEIERQRALERKASRKRGRK